MIFMRLTNCLLLSFHIAFYAPIFVSTKDKETKAKLKNTYLLTSKLTHNHHDSTKLIMDYFGYHRR